MEPASTVRLDDQLCFALYAASNTVVRAYRPLLREIGLTYPQYLTLMTLWQQDGLSVAQVAERLRLPSNALTPLLMRLEQLGYVVRRRDAGDGRVVRVRLTPRGSDLEPLAAAAQHRVQCRTGLDDDELAALRTRLHDLVDDMLASAACDQPVEGEAS